MATYIALTRFTDQGIRSVKETTKRAEAVKAFAAKFGAKVKDLYWTLGQYDLVVVVESDDELSATAFTMSIGSMGNTRSETLRAFSGDEMQVVVSRLA